MHIETCKVQERGLEALNIKRLLRNLEEKNVGKNPKQVLTNDSVLTLKLPGSTTIQLMLINGHKIIIQLDHIIILE